MANITDTEAQEALDAVNPGWFGPFTNLAGFTDNEADEDDPLTFETASGAEVTASYNQIIDPVVIRQLIIAAEVDVIAGDVDAGAYGPLVRITGDDAMPSANRNSPRIEFETDNGNTVFLSFDRLRSAAIRNYFVGLAEGWNSKIDPIIGKISDAHDHADGLSHPYSYSDYKQIMENLNAISEGKARL